MNKKNSDQRFRDLFNKKRGSIIIAVMVCLLIVFGIGQTISWFVWVLASSPFVVVFWATIGNRVIDFKKLIRFISSFKHSAINKNSFDVNIKKRR